MDTPFEPKSWLAALATIGGGYALMAGRQLSIIVDRCDADALESVMMQITGRPERLEAVKRAIELRQCGEVA